MRQPTSLTFGGMPPDDWPLLTQKDIPLSSGVNFERLHRWETRSVVSCFVALAVFGCIVEYRTTFLSRRMGDLNCFLRAAWAVRTGHDFYQIRDDCGWHYNYPPLLAIVVAPLADAPVGADRAGMVPYSVSVAFWFLFNAAAVGLGVHWLACALEERTVNQQLGKVPTGCRRWWGLRLLPVLACIFPLGHSLMRGQINPVVLLCLCASIAALVRGQSMRAGWWLAWPICIKVYPAFLLVYALMRRDTRLLWGCAGGLVVGLVLVPAAAFGPAAAWDYYLEFYQVTLAPGLGIGTDTSRASELTTVTATDSQSLLASMHNTLHLARESRPPQASQGLRYLSYLLGGLMTLATFWAAGRRAVAAAAEPLLFGGLIAVMLLLCPLCHLHYFCLLVPLVMGLLAAAWGTAAEPRCGPGLLTLLGANLLMTCLPLLPGLEITRDLGVAMYAAILLWATAVVVLYRLPVAKGVPGASKIPVEQQSDSQQTKGVGIAA